MALTKRELNLLIFCMAAIVILLSDKYVISPILAARTATSEQRAEISAQKQENVIIVNTSGPAAQRKWKQMQKDGLVDNSAKAESQVINYLNELSTRHRILLSSIQPNHGEKKDGIGIIEFIIAGNAQALNCYEFIWNIETTPIPLKIQSLQISSKDTSSGQVSIQLKISSIYSYQVQEKEEN